MQSAPEIAGSKFGKLTAVRFDSRKGPNNYWLFKCECGNELVAPLADVKFRSKRREIACRACAHKALAEKIKTHGHSAGGEWSPLYRTWSAMRERCTNPKQKCWHLYGGKGVKIEWASFEDFLRDMGPTFQKGLSIGRKDSNGNYTKDNCRWETTKEQARNTSTNVNVSAFGQTKCISAWAEDVGIDPEVIRRRLIRGWKPEDAIMRAVRRTRV